MLIYIYIKIKEQYVIPSIFNITTYKKIVKEMSLDIHYQKKLYL